MKQQQEINKNLFIQIWRNPIFYGELLADVTPEQWHTFTGLAVFMNNEGKCNPSLSKLKQILGLTSIASVSRRITTLKEARFNGEPLLIVHKGKKRNLNGKWLYANNTYQLNQEIITIFNTKNSAYSQQQMEKIKEMKEKLKSSFSFGENRKDDNITKNSF